MTMPNDPLIVSLKKKTVETAATPRLDTYRTSFPWQILAGLFVVVCLLGAGWYVYGGAFLEAVDAPADLSISGLSSSTALKVPGTTITMTEAELLARVSKLIDVPQEQATIAVVSDLAPLSNQAFFKNARVGDIVLMYKKSLRAILYDPESNRIVEVAPITFSDQ